MIVLKKNGKYLAYKKVDDDYEYSDLSEVAATDQSGYHWTSDYEQAKYFMSKDDVAFFLVRKKGDFWQGAVIADE